MLLGAALALGGEVFEEYDHHTSDSYNSDTGQTDLSYDSDIITPEFILLCMTFSCFAGIFLMQACIMLGIVKLPTRTDHDHNN